MGLRNRNLLKDEQCFFVTTTCNKWLKLIDSIDNITIVADSITFLCNKYKADILGYVVMPNHLHLIIFFRETNNLSNYMRDLKKYTSTQLRKSLDKNGVDLTSIKHEVRDQKFKIWQDRFDDVFIVSKEVLYTKLNYIHNNPLQQHWQLAQTPEDFPYSSACFYSTGQNGIIPVTHCAEYFW